MSRVLPVLNATWTYRTNLAGTPRQCRRRPSVRRRVCATPPRLSPSSRSSLLAPPRHDCWPLWPIRRRRAWIATGKRARMDRVRNGTRSRRFRLFRRRIYNTKHDRVTITCIRNLHEIGSGVNEKSALSELVPVCEFRRISNQRTLQFRPTVPPLHSPTFRRNKKRTEHFVCNVK